MPPRYIKNEESATGTHMRLIHGLNRPTPGTTRLLSHRRPIVTSVTASVSRASIMIVPTAPAEMPTTSV